MVEFTRMNHFTCIFYIVSTCLPCKGMQQSLTADNVDPYKWTPDDVCSWLMNHNIGEEESVQIFKGV